MSFAASLREEYAEQHRRKRFFKPVGESGVRLPSFYLIARRFAP